MWRSTYVITQDYSYHSLHEKSRTWKPGSHNHHGNVSNLKLLSTNLDSVLRFDLLSYTGFKYQRWCFKIHFLFIYLFIYYYYYIYTYNYATLKYLYNFATLKYLYNFSKFISMRWHKIIRKSKIKKYVKIV
jgi:hypothetical protein